ncbi:IS66 family insertion sequence element accessory protein TnpB [Paraburkholderia sp. CNPSo 3157]|uniref:IS66 family insertion sequence element accessory protein TnpB n=1 Tax=Paraburkholderia franconis TaxID=2654983 RepID=A0A7X1NM29_9BURK|nr:IS66 family insertion sequence element accessory protein TnpB [Paraburkholderia franconis]
MRFSAETSTAFNLPPQLPRTPVPTLAPAKVQTVLQEEPHGGDVFIFRGRRGDLIKILWATSDGLWLLAKRLERGRFVWPKADSGKIHLTQAQLSMLLEGIDWRQPRRTAEPMSML